MARWIGFSCSVDLTQTILRDPGFNPAVLRHLSEVHDVREGAESGLSDLNGHPDDEGPGSEHESGEDEPDDSLRLGRFHVASVASEAQEVRWFDLFFPESS